MSTENPYIAPTAEVGTAPAPVPAEVLKKIKHAWIAGAVSGSITLALVLASMAGIEALGFTAWELLDVALIAGLVFGIHRKSRTCAVAMLVYFILSKILIMIEGGRPTGLLISFIFIYFYWGGITGTFQYHRLQKRGA
ncbi:hypothetical protein H4F99_03330 [Lysobacter sp. SG-8]|uniref:Uncharacterized protein n=1 Tax=Marilutibacter penaei TaxID=2759900 RepID=A0A7W3U238_9GAMM|nr:hypothetical protein [Lysobacter penaei]MBB1087517.1 hypothetical protein [Lysobacter penaei]